MKNAVNNLLAVILLATAMSTAVTFSSCTKQEPDRMPGTPAQEKPTVNNADTPELQFEGETSVLAYVGEPVKVSFKTSGEGKSTCKVEFTSDSKSAVEGSYNAASGSGHFTVTLNDSANHTFSLVKLTVKGDGKDRNYSVKVTAYYLDITVKDIVLPGSAGADARLEYSIDTNIPDFVPVISTEAPWLTLEENTVTTTQENTSGETRTAEIILSDKNGHFEPVTLKVSQETLAPLPKPECVNFTDWAFKKACLEIADSDKDGEISFAEAESVQELVIVGKGIKDLTGLEAFKNVWKLDARNNDIEDADILKELHYLHWLDLQGNNRLRTFDLTGCTIYFDHCKYATPEGLRYTVLRRQVGVSGGQDYALNSDPECKYSKHIRDERVTTDWSRQDELVLIKPHTKTWKKDGKEMSYAICLTGMGYIDVDINDGSMDRLMKDFADNFYNCGNVKDKWDYFDVYYMSHIMESRFKYQLPREEYYNTEKGEVLRKAALKEFKELDQTVYNKIFNKDDSGTKKLFSIKLCLTNFPTSDCINALSSLLPCYVNDRSDYEKYMRNAYKQSHSLSRYLEDEMEIAYSCDRSPQMPSLFELLEDDINTILEEIF